MRTMFVTSLPRIKGLFKSAHMEKCVTASGTGGINVAPVTSGMPTLAVFVKAHPAVPHLEHVEVVPSPGTPLLAHRGGKVYDARHGAVCGRRAG